MVCLEECFEIKVQNEYVRGIIHKGNNSKILIFCPGLAGDRVDCHRIPVDFGRYVANNGWDLIRFDYRGIGISDGNTILYGYNDILTDITAVIDYVSSYYEKITLIGISQAAIQTYYLANNNDKIDALLLWSPLFDKDNSMINTKKSMVEKSNSKIGSSTTMEKVWNNEHEELKKGKTMARPGDVVRISRKFQREKFTHLLGYPNTGMWISSRYYEERKKILDQCIEGNKRSIKIALFRGELDESVLHDLFTQRIANDVGMITVENGDHLFSNVYSRMTLFRKSAQWLNESIK